MVDNGAHLLAVPSWLLFVHVAQFIFAVIVVGLVGYATSQFSGWDWSGLSIFTAVVTWIACAYIIVAMKAMNAIYNYWAVLALNIFLAIFWLSTMALLASWAATYSFLDDTFNYDGYYYDNSFAKRVHDTVAAAAGMSGIELILFVVSLIFTALAVFKHNKSGVTNDPEVNMQQVPAASSANETTYQNESIPQQQDTYAQPQTYAAPANEAQYSQPQTYAQTPNQGAYEPEHAQQQATY